MHLKKNLNESGGVGRRREESERNQKEPAGARKSRKAAAAPSWHLLDYLAVLVG